MKNTKEDNGLSDQGWTGDLQPPLAVEPKTIIGKLVKALVNELQTPSITKLEELSGMSAGEIMARIASHG